MHTTSATGPRVTFVAQTTQVALSSRRRPRSSVLIKTLMAVSGLIMVLFLLAHMYGNLKVFAGQQAFDEYSHHLRTMGTPILPERGALTIIEVVLTASVIAHFVSAFVLWRRANLARGGTSRYVSSRGRRGMQRSYASFTLRWGGIVILLFVIYHLLNMTWDVIHPGGVQGSPYARLVASFHAWWMVLIYVISLLSVGLHLRHGVWSALTTLGANRGPRARRNLNVLAYVIAIVITVGFLIVPFGVVIGWVK